MKKKIRALVRIIRPVRTRPSAFACGSTRCAQAQRCQLGARCPSLTRR